MASVCSERDIVCVLHFTYAPSELVSVNAMDTVNACILGVLVVAGT